MVVDKSVLPRVSVVLPTYRRVDMLQRAIGTVTAQTFQQWELIIVDDNGAGHPLQLETAAALERHRDDPRIVYRVHEHNQGGGAARNTGIEHAHAEYVAFLDDDDAWYPQKLEWQLDCFERSPAEVGLVYGGFRSVKADGSVRLRTPDSRGHTVSQLLRRNTIGTTSLVMCRRSALEAIGGFDPRLRSRQDLDLFVRLAQRYRFAYVDELLLDKFQHDADAIGKNQDGIVDAHRHFYDKYREAYEQDPVAHHAFLHRYGEEVLRAGHVREARRLLTRAWRLRPQAWRSLVLAGLAHRPILSAYRSVREALGLRRKTRAPVGDEPAEPV